jgi:hypothetical protein
MLGEHERPRPGKPLIPDNDSYRELSRLIAAEIDALHRHGDGDGGDEPLPRRRQDAVSHDREVKVEVEVGTTGRGEAAFVTDAEEDFVDVVAAWLRRRPAKRELLRRIGERVLTADTVRDAGAGDGALAAEPDATAAASAPPSPPGETGTPTDSLAG